jgi:hypothetical protein
MKRDLLNFAAFATWIALRASAAGDDAGNSYGVVPGRFEQPARAAVTANFTWGELTSGRIVETQTTLGRHTATEYQRRIAERNAKIFFKQLTPAKKVELKKRHVRDVLISTVRSRETSPKAKAIMMRFSLEGESLVDGDAYEFETQPPVGTVAKFTGSDPEYVGL